MATFRFPSRLTPVVWEAVLPPRRGPLAMDGGWSRRVAEEGLHLDFARVEFADLAALARALLLVDAAVRDGLAVRVTLPTAALAGDGAQMARTLQKAETPAGGLSADSAHLRLTQQARARGDARTFMRQVGFLDALRAGHWPVDAVQLDDAAMDMDNEQPEEPLSVGGKSPSSDAAPYLLRRMLPFQWLPPLMGEALHNSDAFQSTLARLRDLGLSQPDVNALGQTVLAELLENVAEHAGGDITGPAPYALVSAVRLDPKTYASRHRDLPPYSADLVRGASETGSHVLRLIVGDSGVGLATRLGPVQARHGASSGVRLTADRRLTEVEDTVFYAFGYDSAWYPEPARAPEAPRRGHNGLWRVAHLVNSYRGSTVVRTADAMAGWVYGESEGGTAIAQGSLGRAPGTLHEVDVLTDPKAQPAPVTWVDRSTSAEDRTLRWVRCAFDPVQGLAEGDRNVLAQAARAATQDPATGGVVVSVSMRDAQYLTSSALQKALSSALGAASAIADATAVAVLFPDADPRILDLSVTGLHTAEERTTGAPPSPVLVQGRYGPPIWYGGSAALRAVLAELSRAGGVLPLSAALRHWSSAGGVDAHDGLSLALDKHQQLLGMTGGQLSLRISPVDVLRTLEQATHRELADAIDAGGEGAGVARGLFRTPGLRIIDRWMDVGQLLAATIGPEAGAFVLARKVEAALRQSGKPALPTVVAHVANAPRPLVTRLSECLSLGGRHYTMPGELDLDGLAPGERVSSGERVVLCTDLLSTENTARRAAAAIAGAQADPAVIACVVDARPVRGPIELLNRSIPVVSLTDVDIALGKPTETDTGTAADAVDIVDIDPILRNPLVPALVEEPPVSEIEFLQWCALAPGTLSLGHVAGPRSHSSATLHLDRALRHPETGAKITDAVLHVLTGALGVVSPSGSATLADAPLQLWYAGTPDDAYDSRLPDAVCARLREGGARVGPAVPVPRGVAGNRWIFPTALRHDARGHTVIVLDGRATTGTTLYQMIRLAAEGGADAVVCVVLLDRLDGQDAAALRSLRAVASPNGDGAVPAIVRFVSTSSIPGEPPHSCAICATRLRGMDEGPVPGRLRRHARRLQDLLVARQREEVFSTAAADLFSVPVSSDDVIDYVRWRGLLRRALRDTATRQEVVDRLQALLGRPPAPELTRDNLMRLLAAEQQWLKLPPLRFTVARDLVAQICVAGLRKSVNVSPWLRVQALMVLAGTTPQLLCELLPELLTLALDESILVDQMFLECYRLLRRPPNDSPIDVVRLRTSLLRCRNKLEELRGPRAPAHADDFLHVVQELITIADYKARPKPDDPQKAWAYLREDLGHAVIRHRLDAELLRVRAFVEDLEEATPTPRATMDARADWEGCKRHLAERALVCLPALRHILAGQYVHDRIGNQEYERLQRLVQEGIGALSGVTERLDLLLRESRSPDDPDWQRVRFELLDRINWWYRMFLATHLPEEGNRALVVDLVSSAPTALEPRIAELLATHRADAEVVTPGLGTGSGTQVFCPSTLLDETVQHVLANTDRHRIPGAGCRIRVEYSPMGPGAVRVLIRNSGTREGLVPGQGLRSLDDKLRPFGASLIGRALPPRTSPGTAEWTFEAVLTLPLWEGA